MKYKAVYAGSFDPVTLGHMCVIEKASRLFDWVYVCVSVNPKKQGFLDIHTRHDLIKEALSQKLITNASVVLNFDKFTVNYAKELGANYLVRGIRTASDLEHEDTLNTVNSDIDPTIETVYFFPPKYLSGVSSSLVRGMIGFQDWEDSVQRYVPENVSNYLIRKHHNE